MVAMISLTFGDYQFNIVNNEKISQAKFYRFRLMLYYVLDHIFYGFLDWHCLFKANTRKFHYLCRYTESNVLSDTRIPFKKMVMVSNVFGFQNMLDLVIYVSSRNKGKIDHSGLVKFLSGELKYDSAL